MTKRADAEAAIERVNTLTHEGKTGAAASLAADAEALIVKCAPKDRARLRDDLKVALVRPADEGSSSSTQAVMVVDYHQVAGVDELVDDGIKRVRDAVEQGLKAVDVAHSIADLLLDARLRMFNKAGLPDILSSSKFTKNIAHDMYTEAQKDVPVDDVDRIATHRSLAKAVRNRMSDVMVKFMQGLDAEKVASQFPQALPKVAEGLSPMEAVYATYAEVGFDIPRKGRTELAREDARERAALVARLKAEGRELPPSASDEDDEDELTKDVLALEKSAKALTRVSKKAAVNLSDEDKAKLKARMNALVATLAAEAARL